MLVDLGVWGGAVTSVTAQDEPPPPGKGPEFGKASPIGLVVILLLGIATVFLVRSMGKHLRRVPASFDPPPADETPERPASDPASDPTPSRPTPSQPTEGDTPPR